MLFFIRIGIKWLRDYSILSFSREIAGPRESEQEVERTILVITGQEGEVFGNK